MDNDWFELRDIRRRSIAGSVWVPLQTGRKLREVGQYGHEGYVEEYFGSVCVMFPVDLRDEALSVQWSTARRSWSSRPSVEGDDYIACDAFVSSSTGHTERYVVLQQLFDTGDPEVWYLHQDLVLGLKLLREEDVWVCPEEDYVNVARLERDENGLPVQLNIRMEYLRDYLCANNCGLLVCTYRSRRAVAPEFPQLTWADGTAKETADGIHWEGYIREIHEGGTPYGQKMAVFRTYRTDVDDEEDVPSFDLGSDGGTASESYKVGSRGRKLLYACGEMWRNEWIAPGQRSSRIRGDHVEPSIPFIVSNDGTTATTSGLVGARHWLWFQPTVVNALLARRGGTLGWYTEDTGAVGAGPHETVHFGVNSLGLVNVFAKDIGQLPERHQKLWVAHNVSPEGGVSTELLDAQMRTRPADTTAPEEKLVTCIAALQSAAVSAFDRPLFRSHAKEQELLRGVHRFRSLDLSGFCSLAKDITRLTTDRIDVGLLKELRPREDKDIRSLKRLERLLSAAGVNGRRVLGPLAGAYELRHADAHLPSSDLTDAMKLAGVTDDGHYLHMGRDLIDRVGFALCEIAHSIQSPMQGHEGESQ